mmetsp:Transcript_110445/g.235945  ORF Transcript_110445/g.235945 Transcript_110445/m.235945 type:complete len:262 (+) Transcript_110445:1301-2086(+)
MSGTRRRDCRPCVVACVVVAGAAILPIRLEVFSHTFHTYIPGDEAVVEEQRKVLDVRNIDCRSMVRLGESPRVLLRRRAEVLGDVPIDGGQQHAIATSRAIIPHLLVKILAGQLSGLCHWIIPLVFGAVRQLVDVREFSITTGMQRVAMVLCRALERDAGAAMNPARGHVPALPHELIKAHITHDQEYEETVHNTELAVPDSDHLARAVREDIIQVSTERFLEFLRDLVVQAVVYAVVDGVHKSAHNAREPGGATALAPRS